MGYITNVLILEILSRLNTYSAFKADIIYNRDISKNSFIMAHQGKRWFGLIQQMLRKNI